jgi:hypothetical protein
MYFGFKWIGCKVVPMGCCVFIEILMQWMNKLLVKMIMCEVAVLPGIAKV